MKKRTRTPSTLRAARAELIKRMKALSAERDQLQALKDDLEDLISSCDDAMEGLECACEALSRYV